MEYIFSQNSDDYESFFTFKEGKIITQNGVVLAEEFEHRRWFNDVLTDYLGISYFANGVFLFGEMKTTTRVGKDDWEHYYQKLAVISKIDSHNLVLKKYDYCSYNFLKGNQPLGDFFLEDINKLLFLQSIKPFISKNNVFTDNIKNVKLSFDKVNSKDLYTGELNIEQYNNIIQEGVEKVFLTLLKCHIINEIVYNLNTKEGIAVIKPASSILNFYRSDGIPQLNNVPNTFYQLPDNNGRILIHKTDSKYRFIIKPKNTFGIIALDYLTSITDMNNLIQLSIESKYNQYSDLRKELPTESILKPLTADIMTLELNTI